MYDNSVVFSIFLIFSGAAIFSTLALYSRQSLLVAYMLLGLVLGPWGLKLISSADIVHRIDDIGIIFLLFLLGLNLHPQDLLHMFKEVFWVTLVSSLLFGVIGFVIGYWFGFAPIECFVIGATMMFSSTIIGLKLLPTTVLHHQHTGELVISILLMQDLLAILLLLMLHAASMPKLHLLNFVTMALSLPTLLLTAFLFVKFVLNKLFAKFDRIHEYIFLLAIAWCLSMSELARLFGLSHEIGAFIAGVSIAVSPISLYIAESLKPLRDFFLVLFFFSIGASFNLQYFRLVIIPASVLAVILLIAKPVVFRFLLARADETKNIAWEVGIRLGQTSSFSLLLAYLAASSGVISPTASYLVQATTMLTFIVSAYMVVFKYPTPLAVSEKLRSD